MPTSDRTAPGLGLGIAALVLVLDQASKLWIRETVLEVPRIVPLSSFFNLVWVWNPGISFGFLGGATYAPWLFSILALAIVAVLLVWLWRCRRRLIAVAVGLIVGGALGNVVDRLVHGAVFDFVDLHVAGYHWPAFNLADSAITVGTLLVVLEAVFPSLFGGGGSAYNHRHD